MKKLLVILPLALAFPTHAVAAPTGSLCDDVNATLCYTIAPGDQLATTTGPSTNFGYINSATNAPLFDASTCEGFWHSRAEWQAAGSPRDSRTCVKVGGTINAYTFSRFRFPDLPVADMWNFHADATLSTADYVVEGVTVRKGDTTVNGRATFVIGSPTESYCNFYTQGFPANTQPGVARDATPASVYAACVAERRFNRHASDPAPTKPTVSTPTAGKPAESITVPQSAAKCGTVGKVTVRSTAVACTSARSVVARYAKSLKSPAGWSCSAVVNDAGRRVRCTPKAATHRSAARKAVYGLWRS